MKLPIRVPPWSDYGIRTNALIEALAVQRGTPQYNYRNAVGWRYRLWRRWNNITDYFRTRGRLWWFLFWVVLLGINFLWHIGGHNLSIKGDPAKTQPLTPSQQLRLMQGKNPYAL